MIGQGGLFGDAEWWEDYWRGMPEFIQLDCEPKYSLQVDLRTQADAEAFQALVRQRVKAPGKSTKSIWYPEAEIGRFADKAYISSTPCMPKYPVYVISKGRWDSRITVRHLERLKIPYHIAVEPQEYDQYAAVIDPKKILVTPFSNLGQGSIPVRNFIWEHSISIGAERHWCMDDNLNGFFRLNKNLKTPIADPTIFRCAEDWSDRYSNIALSGFQYWMFVSRKVKLAPVALNTRIYSCILINNSIPYRWRGRYNEDTDLSIRALKDGWSTALFYAFICDKETTMTMKGGNTDELYKDDGRRKMAQSLVDQHPDITKISWKWGRWQHQVDYRGFRKNVPVLKPGTELPTEMNNYGMKLFRAENWPKSSSKEPWECPELLVPVEDLGGAKQLASGSTAKSMERLDAHQNESTTLAAGRMAEPENSLGVLVRGRSVETPPTVREMSLVAVARPLPTRSNAELETGAQVNEPQHPDVSSASSPPSSDLFGLGEWWEPLWQNMPEFVQDDLKPLHSIEVQLRTKADADEFERLAGKIYHDKWLWYPPKEYADWAKDKWITQPKLQPTAPVYIISKGRWESRLTAKALDRLGTPYFIAVEPSEASFYASVIDPAKVLVLPFQDLGQGSIPARNFIWEHSIERGFAWHWCMDDNIENFYRLNRNVKLAVDCGVLFKVAEEFVWRYSNIGLAGLQYESMIPRRQKVPPMYLNTRIYSCILIRNDLPFRWRGRYNEDTDLSLRVLKSGLCTVLFNAFLAKKIATMRMSGGNTDQLYQGDGRLKMAESLVEQHPDVTKVVWKWGRHQHHVDYTGFKRNALKLRHASVPPGVNEYGMAVGSA